MRFLNELVGKIKINFVTPSPAQQCLKSEATTEDRVYNTIMYTLCNKNQAVKM
jgi:hypothetical protein